MKIEPIAAYPLHWPTGKVRTPLGRRAVGRFESRPFGQIRDELLAELIRLHARAVIVSTNIETRGDGLPYANTREPADGGVAVYFERRGKPYTIACDTYDRVWKNLRAITLTVAALRAIERHASTQMMEQAFTGFAALPPAQAGAPSWWEVLGIRPNATVEEINRAHLDLALKCHPDRGGDGERMARINHARDVALEERGA